MIGPAASLLPVCKFDPRSERIIPHLKTNPSVARLQFKDVAVAPPKFFILTKLSCSVQSSPVCGACLILQRSIVMKTLITALALTAILATSAVAKTPRPKEVRVQHNNSVTHNAVPQSATQI